MVVTGAQGLSGIRRALLGSVSTGLVHHARLPVLVVPGGSGDETRHGPLLLCYDASEASARAIGVAGELLVPAEALVLHVWESWVAHSPALAGARTGRSTNEQSSASSGPSCHVRPRRPRPSIW